MRWVGTSSYLRLTWLEKKGVLLIARNGSLAILVSSRNYQGMGSTFNIWVMNEYRVKEYWTKKLTVGRRSANRFVRYGKNEKLLFSYHSSMYLYDLQRVKPPRDHISKADDFGHNFVQGVEAVNDHIESLVTIEGTKVCVKREHNNSWFGEKFIFFLSLLSHRFIKKYKWIKKLVVASLSLSLSLWIYTNALSFKRMNF